MRRCPICGSPGHTCGPRTTVTPVDLNLITIRKDSTMTDEPREVREYHVLLNGTPTTLQLTPEDYEAQGWVPADDPNKPAVQKTEEADSNVLHSQSLKGRKPANKAREDNK